MKITLAILLALSALCSPVQAGPGGCPFPKDPDTHECPCAKDPVTHEWVCP